MGKGWCVMGKFFVYSPPTTKNYDAVSNLIYTYKLGAVYFTIYAYLYFNQHGKWNAPLVDCKSFLMLCI